MCTREKSPALKPICLQLNIRAIYAEKKGAKPMILVLKLQRQNHNYFSSKDLLNKEAVSVVKGWLF